MRRRPLANGARAVLDRGTFRELLDPFAGWNRRICRCKD